MCMAFYRHVEDHANNDNVNSHGRQKYKEGFYCHWKGCNSSPKSSLNKLVEHIRTHTKERIIACPFCCSEFCSNSRFLDHLMLNGPQKYICELCHKTKATQALLNQHIRIHINTTKCPHCEMSLVNKNALKRHILYRHSNVFYIKILKQLSIFFKKLFIS